MKLTVTHTPDISSEVDIYNKGEDWDLKSVTVGETTIPYPDCETLVESSYFNSISFYQKIEDTISEYYSN